MEILHNADYNPDLALALGYFDGVHPGHKAVIKSAADYARQHGNKSAVVTFVDHPCCFLYNVHPKYILTREERRCKISELGTDYIYELDFKSIAHLNAQEYLAFLTENFKPVSISTGCNHFFGLKKSGTTEYLNKMSCRYGYKYFEIPTVTVQDRNPQNEQQVISSTGIRNALAAGDIQKANSMLGYNFTITGKVIAGQKLGQQLGFPTANLIYPPELIDLPFGVYCVLVNIEEENFKGAANFGVRPTISGKVSAAVLEVHLLDFDRNIYGQEISVEFLKMLRSEQKFDSVEALKAQIAKDIG
ncbi:MAG: riboflavin biosynthesis protein RibF [Heliobacteriaceae bacterium]|jgi:riboflavin kinase/FMN adenylyltransferase|nr:riboflavin biosynthesis protein RibF [Heliobacteriaceae bacterium]